MQVLLPDPLKRFRYLQCLMWFAGIMALLQSLAWIGLTIIGVTAYYCKFDKVKDTDTSVQAITQQTFHHMYFGDCSESKYIDFAQLDTVTLKLNYHHVNTWIWVYMAIHVIWLISSASLLRKIDKSRLVMLNTILLIWVVITLAISAMDIGLGILFGMDYGDILAIAGNTPYNNADGIPATLLAGMTSSMSMMIIALRGFFLWLLNVILLSYFFVQTFVISKTPTSLTGQDNEGFVSETQSEIILSKPIDAFASPNGEVNRNSTPLQLNVEPLKRATAMSVDSLLQRHYQRYPPGNDTKDENSPSQKDGYDVLAETNTFKPYPTVPDPDYSPQMISVTTPRTRSEPALEGRSAF